MKLETERLVLREVKDSDAEILAKKLNNINISKWITAMPYPYSKKDAEWWINQKKEKNNKDFRNDYHLILKLKENKDIVGVVGVFGFDKDKIKGELGYWISEEYWKKGYVKEALKKLIEFSFNDLNLGKLVIPCFVENKGSNAVAKRLGFELEGTFKRSVKCVATDKIHDENIYGLLKKDWMKIRDKL